MRIHDEAAVARAGCAGAGVVRYGALTAILLVSLFSGRPVSGQEPSPLVLTYEFASVSVKRPKVLTPALVKPPEIDGALNDDCWVRCATRELSLYKLCSDMPDGEPTRLTIVRVCRDENNLYVAFECREPAIGDIPVVKKPLSDVWADENVQVYLAPSGEKDLLLFAVDPNGSRYDRSLREGVSWSPEWEVKTLRTAQGWNAEMAISLKSLDPNRVKEGDQWRVNFCRDIAATGERCAWEPTMGSRWNPASWGLLFFGDAETYVRLPIPPRVTLYPDRWVIRADEKMLRAVVRLDPGSSDLGRTLLRVGVSSEAKTEGTQALPPSSTIAVKGERATLILNVANLPPGDFRLYAELRDHDGGLLVRSEIPLRKEAAAASPAAPPPDKMNIFIPPYPVKAAAAAAWPIHLGVALPKGALYSPTNVRLLGSDGKEIPCKGLVRSRWPGDGSIRWLGLDFRADLTRQGGARCQLEYGPQVAPGDVRGFTRKIRTTHTEATGEAYVLEIQEEEDAGNGAWWINTGTLLFSVNKRFSGIESAFMDADGNGFYDWTEQILDSRFREAGPYVTDAAGRVYRVCDDPNARVELEEWNELRVVLRAQGRLMPVAGGPAPRDTSAALGMGSCVVRITAYLGQPFLRLQCTFLFNERAAHTLFTDIGILEKLYNDRRNQAVDISRRFEAIFGVPGGFRHPAKDTGPVFVMKLAPEQFILQNVSEPVAYDLHGTGAEDWAAAASDRGFAVALRDMGHLYPKGMEMVPETRQSKNGVYIHFWPPQGNDNLRSLKGDVNRKTVGALGFATSGRMLDLRVPASFAGGLKDRDGLSDFDAVRNMDLADPTGLALTYDMLYTFFKGAFDAHETAELGRTFELSPHGVQDPQSLAASGVLAETLPPKGAERAAAMVARLLKLEERSPAEGDVNYMDLRRKWLPREQRWALRGYWMGTRGDLPAALWLLYLQTGKPDILLAAERNTRHVTSVDICHDALRAQIAQADPRRRKIPGAFGDHKTPVHWLSTCSVSDHYARVRGLLLAYYLTGDLMARDTALLWAEAAKSYGPATSGEDGMTYLSNLSELLYLSYDPALVERVGDCADYLFHMPLSLEGAEFWVPGLQGYLRSTGDGRVRGYLESVGAAAKELGAPEGFRLIGLLRDLHAVTGDRSYLEQARRLVEQLEKAIDQDAASDPDDAKLCWEDFCAYVAGAAEPIGAAKAAAPPAPTPAK